jgi:hypothetical protein
MFSNPSTRKSDFGYQAAKLIVPAAGVPCPNGRKLNFPALKGVEVERSKKEKLSASGAKRRASAETDKQKKWELLLPGAPEPRPALGWG